MNGIRAYLQLRWLVVSSLLVGIIGLFAPRYMPASESVDATYETTAAALLIFVVLLVLALVMHRRRGLLLLISLPLILYWPIGFAALDYACKHNVSACP
ncbi:MAG TPA: hypothetical protein VG168_13550 [Bryobacteraceae bacterium]|nr:hypothetical protein [Bryobacteraceae bacterium]